MNTAALIRQAADLMADIDAGAAHVFRTQPFRRALIAAAFRRGFRTHTALSLRICDVLDRAAALDSASRLLGA